MSKVEAYAHLKGIQLLICLDDWLLRSLDPQQLQLDTIFMLELCAFLGLNVNVPKSDLTPSQEFVFLEILFQTVRYTCRPLVDRWKQLVMLLHHARNSSFLCEAVDEACRHSDINGLSGALGQIASATNTTQLSRSLGLEKAFSDSAESAHAE